MMAITLAVNKSKMKVNIVLIAPSALMMSTWYKKMCLHHGAKNILRQALTAMCAYIKR